VVCLSVCLFMTIVSPAKTAEPIEMSFGVWTRWAKEACVSWGGTGAHWRYLANTIESSMCDGDAGILSHCFDHLLNVVHCLPPSPQTKGREAARCALRLNRPLLRDTGCNLCVCSSERCDHGSVDLHCQPAD